LTKEKLNEIKARWGSVAKRKNLVLSPALAKLILDDIPALLAELELSNKNRDTDVPHRFKGINGGIIDL